MSLPLEWAGTGEGEEEEKEGDQLQFFTFSPSASLLTQLTVSGADFGIYARKALLLEFFRKYYN